MMDKTAAGRCCDRYGIGDHDSAEHATARSADLPVYSVVAHDITTIWIKRAAGHWHNTSGDGGNDTWVQHLLDDGAQVLRVGTE